MNPEPDYFGPLVPKDGIAFNDDFMTRWLQQQTFSAQKIITGSLQASQIISSSNFVTGTSGWQIDGDGNSEFNDIIVRGDIESGNWNGTSPANLASKDAGATAGFYLDSSAGAAQFEGSVWIDGALDVAGATTLRSTITMATGGVLRTAASGSRIEILNSTDDAILFYNAAGSNAAVVGLDGDNLNLSVTGATANIVALLAGGDVDLGGAQQVLIPAGIDSAPGLAIDGDSNTGIYGAAANVLGGVAGGLEVWRALNNGDLGLTNHRTVASAANAFIRTLDGVIFRSTSSARRKTAIRPWDYRHSVTLLTPSLFRSKADGDDGRKVHLGLIAEDVAENFPIAALYDEEGLPDAINWNAITAGLIAEVQWLSLAVARLDH